MPEENIPERVKTLDEIVNGFNEADDVTLKDTTHMMCNSDYKIRFVAEYMQTKIRYNSLHKMIVKMEAGTLDFIPDTPIDVLKNQKSFMGQYLNQLEIRAEIENIPLPKL